MCYLRLYPSYVAHIFSLVFLPSLELEFCFGSQYARVLHKSALHKAKNYDFNFSLPFSDSTSRIDKAKFWFDV